MNRTFLHFNAQERAFKALNNINSTKRRFAPHIYHKMKFQWQFIAVSIAVFLIIHNRNSVNAECCNRDIIVSFPCGDNKVNNSFPFGLWGIGKWSCRAHICNDGVTISPIGYCGIGDCNIIGCNCKGGCRTNSKENSTEEALRLFKEKYQVKEAQHGRWILKKIGKLKNKIIDFFGK